MNLQTVVGHVTKNWKTTLSGMLSAVIGFSAVASTPNPWIPSNLGIKILGAAAISKILLGMIQTDGTQTTVNLPAGAAPAQINIPADSQIKQETTITTPK
jgi:hypothetical protein